MTYDAVRTSQMALFSKGLGMPPRKTANMQATDNVPVDEGFKASQDSEFRTTWPLLSYLADLEHVRWCALYRAMGWRDVPSVLDDDRGEQTSAGHATNVSLSTKDRLDRVQQRLQLEDGTHHTALRLHYYLCDSVDELAQRGEDCRDNPFADDRTNLWHSIDILDGAIAE